MESTSETVKLAKKIEMLDKLVYLHKQISNLESQVKTLQEEIDEARKPAEEYILRQLPPEKRKRNFYATYKGWFFNIQSYRFVSATYVGGEIPSQTHDIAPLDRYLSLYTTQMSLSKEIEELKHKLWEVGKEAVNFIENVYTIHQGHLIRRSDYKLASIHPIDLEL